MPKIVYRICTLLQSVLASVPVGTNLGLFQLLFALLSGRFLPARGAVFPALAGLGLNDAATRRSEAALAYGGWNTADLLASWQTQVTAEGHFVPASYEGIRPVACDLTAFFRPGLQGLTTRHYVRSAGKALPAVVFGLCVTVGRIQKTRLGLPRLLLRRGADESEMALQKRLVKQAANTLAPGEALIVDAGFSLADLLCLEALPFVARVRTNQTARRNALPSYKGAGRPASRGALVRPLPRTRSGKTLPATPADSTVSWYEGRRQITAQVWKTLVLPDQKPGAAQFCLVAIFDPRYQEPLLLATTLEVSTEALWRLYRDRWAVEQLPLAAKPMLGAERSFVSGKESRYRLPELALLAGNLLSYVAATSVPVSSGFWDRAARPTCGRVRRGLCRLHFSELPLMSGELRKKNSVTAHLPTGVSAHRRQKTHRTLSRGEKVPTFTGN